ncbi:Os01g0772150 [Oryza sativa Japonica Group]|jgi:histone-lysine N-methyltransferase SETMAR|uniref:Os01g0772150 protein n=3 Tax=Oryza sativa TaxID=4530 RepID=A0A0P0V8S0_ORYSJ|nr:histone-lysine N-methyltransferase SUVR3 [Oryza sativa Japonica Group]XP_052145259.1 histone-lysine N-methyltransferase SUVR3 [Oryza glaberrima]KAB8083711.1 hypothetical protein EE612_006008 [Oryza sativa]KAF2952515.1 hypothetical protein DAI22_01g342000 [Oryza sativa Japonica Group]BAS74564.1 Os01g0772150 [Oryza sativa Japonica Group]
MRNSATPGAVGELAELVLPWLPPQDLAAAASASRALRAAASSVSAGRAADAAHGLEPHPIPFDNLVDGKPYAYFLYTPFSLTPSSASASPRRAQPWGRTWARPPGPTWPRSDLGGFPSSGCACAQGACGGARGCPCADPEAEAVGLGSEAGMGSLRECGDGCACGPSCGNRRTQLGVTVRLRVVRHREKGWGLHAAEVLRRGQFVCEYAGELLTTEEARRRQGLYDELASVGKLSPALIVIREHLPSGKACLRVNIDATKVGNVARFINHSCDGGNLHPVLVRSSGSLLPRLCFFAARDIIEGEELTFSYGDARLRPNGLPCFCGSLCCSGLLPSEET